jgi:phospholipid transport system substrate-binding protein
MTWLKNLLAAGFLAAAFAAQAQEQKPDELVKQITDEVMQAIQSDKQLAAGDKQKALKLAEDKILPHVDFQEATRLAVGRSWRQTSAEQKQQLVNEFRRMLLRTYSNAISAYQGQQMKVLPLHMKAGETDVAVRNQYIKPGQKPVQVDYQMHKVGDSWKIYDIIVEGVSLVLTYRSEFDQVVKESGVDGLIKRIGAKNEPAAVGSSSPKK